MKIKIRQATKNDASIVNAFLTRLIQDEKKYDTNINEKCVVTSLYENLIPNDNNCILVAEYEDRIIGYLYGYIEDIGDAYIKSRAQLEAMFVDEKYRNSGIGTMLINDFKIWLKSKNVKYLELKVCNGNKSAIALYNKNGFNNIKRIMMIELGE